MCRDVCDHGCEEGVVGGDVKGSETLGSAEVGTLERRVLLGVPAGAEGVERHVEIGTSCGRAV